jgi:hypothetical protein
VASIQTKLKTGVPPAFLFVGPSGSGKSTIAEILAKDVQGPAYLGEDEFLDIRRINAADKNGVDDVRELAAEAKYFPGYGKYRVIIFDEAHKLTDAAQNALLIPTEPMPNQPTTTVWIFCTTDPTKIIPALKGRCLTYQLKPLTADGVDTLVRRLSGQNVGQNCDSFVAEANRIGLTNPREILYSYDRYISGYTVEEAFTPSPEADPVYTDIAKFAVNGDWEKVRNSLTYLKTADVKGLKSVLGWFFRSALISKSYGAYADSLSETLIRLGNLNSFEDGVTYAAITAIIYNHCKKLNFKENNGKK